MFRPTLILFTLTFLIFHQDYLAQTWTKLADYPGLGRDDAIAFSIGDCGYIVTGNHAGFSESNDMWKYNTTTNQWSKAASFPGEKRQYALAFAHNNFAYILGGISENNLPLNDLYRYNSLSDSWQQLDSFPGLRRWSAAGTIHDKSAYIFGGATLTNCLNDAWRFDFTTETWENLAQIPAVGKRDQLCFSIGEKIYLLSGFSTNPLTFYPQTYAYNIINNTWSTELDFPSEPIGYGTVGNSGNRAIILGGYKEDGTYSDEAWQFFENSWTQLPTCLSIGTRGMSAFSINNKCYFLTGKREDLTLSKDFYCLSFSDENTFSIYPNPSSKKVNFFAAIGSEIKVYNLLGEKITELNFSFNNEISLELSESGIYFAELSLANQQVFTQKFVIL